MPHTKLLPAGRRRLAVQLLAAVDAALVCAAGWVWWPLLTAPDPGPAPDPAVVVESPTATAGTGTGPGRVDPAPGGVDVPVPGGWLEPVWPATAGSEETPDAPEHTSPVPPSAQDGSGEGLPGTASPEPSPEPGPSTEPEPTAEPDPSPSLEPGPSPRG